jgi:hypothetical protein
MPDFNISSKGPNKRAGVGRFAWYSAISEIETIASLPASPSTQADKVTISDDHIFTGTNGFRKMYVDQDQANLIATGIGTIESKAADITLQVYFPGTKKEFAAFIKDDPEMILLVPSPDCDDNEYIQVGSGCSPARINPDWEFKTGTTSGNDGKGFMVNIKATASSVVWYAGTLTEATA